MDHVLKNEKLSLVLQTGLKTKKKEEKVKEMMENKK
jgi:hypothetical protein